MSVIKHLQQPRLYLCSSEGNSLDLVVRIRVHEVLVANHLHEMSHVHLGHEHLVVSGKITGEVVWKWVEMGQVGLGDAAAACSNTANSGSDWAPCRAPAKHEHVGTFGIIDLDVRYVVGDACNLCSAQTRHPLV